MIEIRTVTAVGWGGGGIHERTQDNHTSSLKYQENSV